MRLIIKSKNISLNAPLRAYLEEKLAAPTRKLIQALDPSLPLLEIEFSREAGHHQKGKVWRSETNLSLGRTLIRASAQGESPHEVIDLVEEELRREIKTFMGKQKTKAIQGARKIKRLLKKPLV